MRAGWMIFGFFGYWVAIAISEWLGAKHPISTRIGLGVVTLCFIIWNVNVWRMEKRRNEILNMIEWID